MEFTKPATDVSKQIDILKKRGLQFENIYDYELILKNNNYYRLGEYFYNYQYDRVNHLYIEGTTFESVYNTYLFDCELRKFIFNYIADIEVSIRTKLIYYFSNEIDPWWFVNSDNFYHIINPKIGLSYGNDTIRKIYQTINSSKYKEVTLKTHYKKYPKDKQLPPAWKSLEFCSFGIISNLYKNIKPEFTSKELIASDYNLKYIVLSNWLESLNDLRNICAHHSRLYNRSLTKYATFLKNTSEPWLNMISEEEKLKNTNSVYFNLCIIKYLMNSINPVNKMGEELFLLLSKYPKIDLKLLGFTEDWKKEELWTMK